MGHVLQEAEDLRLAWERLLAARDAIQAALALPAPPPVIVSAGDKDVGLVAERLGLGGGAGCFLWDDNPRLAGRPGVVTVPRYDRLGPAERGALEAYLAQRLPAERLPDSVAVVLQRFRRVPPRPPPPRSTFHAGVGHRVGLGYGHSSPVHGYTDSDKVSSSQ
jgi:hypothetical protein